MKSLFILMLLFITIALPAQNGKVDGSYRLSAYVGKYETNGFVVQVVLSNGSLALVVPGAPLQEMIPLEQNRFRSASFDNSFFVFVEDQGKVVHMISESPGNAIELKKISDVADPVNRGDSLLTLKKSTAHFLFLYTQIDSVSVDHIAARLEDRYNKILRDFKMEKIPVTTVRIYPDVKAFHEGINFPDAPPNVLATAFGKSDIRMPSPHSVSPEDSLNLVNNMTHEFMHCVHLNIDYAPNNPRWLWEAVAMYEADWFLDPGNIEAIKNKNFPPFAALGNGLEYEMGYVIIEAIKDIWGFDAVIGLIKKRGDTQAVLQLSQEKFEEAIYEHIYRKYIPD